jgi:UDP-N-acetylmuramate dehydrogenase
VEQEDLFWDLEALHLKDQTINTFTRSDCRFGYRDSVFKNSYKDQFAILSVTFRLRKKPLFHTNYGAIKEELERMGVKELSIRAISEAVINIRSSKLPDPKEIGNAGSFFKNPIVPGDHYRKLKLEYPTIVGYETMGGSVKLAAGWLIEQSGPKESATWKGYRKGDAGVHAKQALVLVNYGNAKGKEILELSEEIQRSVKKKFDVELEREVNLV